MTSDLHVYRYGPPGPARVLAIHGLTGHGRRWQRIATQQLGEIPVAAPDLLGHGHSSWAAPWNIDANVRALISLLDEHAEAPLVVVGHSFGGAVGLHLAAAHPDRVAGLVLLDPAIGLDGGWMAQIADAMLSSPDYRDASEARAEQANGAWADVEPNVLDEELRHHLVVLPDGRCRWRISLPAMMSYWSELALDPVLPPADTPTTLMRALRTAPPYVCAELITGLRERLGSDFQVRNVDCGHMIAQARPAEVAAAIRERLGAYAADN